MAHRRSAVVCFTCATISPLGIATAQPCIQGELGRLVHTWAQSDDKAGTSVAIDGNRLVFGAIRHGIGGNRPGAAFIYEYDKGMWIAAAELWAPDGMDGDLFGISVDMAGDIAVVGAYRNQTAGAESGAAYVFRRNGTLWEYEGKLVASDINSDWFYGYSVSTDGNRVAIGAYRADNTGTHSGAVYVYSKTTSGWVEDAILTGADTVAGDNFGFDVEILGNSIAVGAYAVDLQVGIQVGAVYIFKHIGAQWVETARLIASDGMVGDEYGVSVSLSEHYLAIGAHHDDSDFMNEGSVYLYRNHDGEWIEEAKLSAPTPMFGNNFGRSVSLSGDRLLVGTPRVQSTTSGGFGSAIAFQRTPAGWVAISELVPSDGILNDFFGYSVAASEVVGVVGAENAGAPGSFTGAVYAFDVRCGGPCVPDVNGDGLLSPADFSAWVAAFNSASPRCDQNSDGQCTPSDFSAWVANYNTGCE